MATIELLLVLLAIGLAVFVNVRWGHLRRLSPPHGPSPRGPSITAPRPVDHEPTAVQKEPVPC